MKKVIVTVLIIVSLKVFSCGYYEWEGMSFYNLMNQENISAQEYYSFLKTEFTHFYGESNSYYQGASIYPAGNMNLWMELLPTWSMKEVYKLVYYFDEFTWDDKKTDIEKRIYKYLEFAQECSSVFSYRKKTSSWDYNDITSQQEVDTRGLLEKANRLMNQETNPVLSARYYYQIIRILHYSKMWSDAIKLFENKLEDKLIKNEVYYYIVDQVAGCYYSTENYDKAAYLFTKVFNHSLDRKKSAFVSYSFCISKGVEGKKYFEGIEDEKDLLLIKSLQRFSSSIDNLKQFIQLDANDSRIELLFMRAFNGMERRIWPKNLGASSNAMLPNIRDDKYYKQLLELSEKQGDNEKVLNKDFWLLANSYLLFINKDIEGARKKMKLVKSFKEQKEILASVYEVFSWNIIGEREERILVKLLNSNAEFDDDGLLNFYSQNDWIKLILDKVSNLYYSNNQIAKAYLIHKHLEMLDGLSSNKLLGALEVLYQNQSKTEFESILVKNINEPEVDFMGYVYNQKGIYHLYHQQNDSAFYYFNKNKTFINSYKIPGTIFSNNTTEEFSLSVSKVMEDEVFKANVFSFIKLEFSRKELAMNLQELEKLTCDSLQWKRKLANYLLGNFYFNISNTGFYRGLLHDRTNKRNHYFVPYAYELEEQKLFDDEIIETRNGYNLSDIELYRRKHRKMADVARKYYEKTIELSSDDELNARCLFLIGKCELNRYYNTRIGETFEVELRYGSLILPEYESFKELKESYSHTKFHQMIINECSYFKHYSAVH